MNTRGSRSKSDAEEAAVEGTVAAADTTRGRPPCSATARGASAVYPRCAGSGSNSQGPSLDGAGGPGLATPGRPFDYIDPRRRLEPPLGGTGLRSVAERRRSEAHNAWNRPA